MKIKEKKFIAMLIKYFKNELKNSPPQSMNSLTAIYESLRIFEKQIQKRRFSVKVVDIPDSLEEKEFIVIIKNYFENELKSKIPESINIMRAIYESLLVVQQQVWKIAGRGNKVVISGFFFKKFKKSAI